MSTTITRAFGLEGEAWMRHANPVSVWTRFAALPLLALAIWSRDWIGWLAVVPVALAVVWIAVNPLFFRPPRSTHNWASRAVFGERISTEADPAALPRQFRSRATTVATIGQVAGLALMAYGLVTLDLLATVAGLVVTQGAKAWYLDRMVLLFEHMKGDEPYRSWDY
jgi:uncharacterized protein DUF6653